MTIRTLGVIGGGRHMREHLRFAEGFEVIGIFDPSAESRQAVCDVLDYAPETFENPEALLAAAPDAVLIGSRDEDHPQQLALAVAAGIPVLCEKPLAVDAKGLDIVTGALDMAQYNRLLVASCHQRRSNIGDLPYGWVKANLAGLETRFGRLKHIRLSSNDPQPTQEWKKERSLLADKFVHDIDYLRSFPQSCQS